MKYYRIILDHPTKAGEIVAKECDFNDTETLLKILHQIWRDDITAQPRIRIKED